MFSSYLEKANTEKHTSHGTNAKAEFASAEMQGWRHSMEDALIAELDLGDGNMIFGVFDGHGGPHVSKFVKNHFAHELVQNGHYKKKNFELALVQTFMKMDELIIKPESKPELLTYMKESEDFLLEEDIYYAGCTACVALITKLNELFVANAGDSRCVLCRKSQAVAMSFDHKPENDKEIKRIKSAGGIVMEGRVNGNLNLSRAIGDFEFKDNNKLKMDEQLVIAKPDVRSIMLSPYDEFIIIGCDGIWETFSNDKMVDYILRQFKNDKKLSQVLESLLDDLVAKNINEDEDGQDNMSAILIRLNRRRNTQTEIKDPIPTKTKQRRQTNIIDGKTNQIKTLKKQGK